MTSTHHDPNIMAVPDDFCLGIPFTDLQSNDQKKARSAVSRVTRCHFGEGSRGGRVEEWVCITAQVDAYILRRSSIRILSRNTTFPVIWQSTTLAKGPDICQTLETLENA
jgi:hypothetical protein